MNKVLLPIFVLMFCAGTVFAQQGSIGIFSDVVGVDCNLLDVGMGLGAYNVVHTGTTGSMACAFVAAHPACLTATYLSDTHPFPVTIGSSQTGVAVGYGSCRVGAIHVLTINYFTMGTTPACCYYPVTCDPRESNRCAGGLLDTVDCSQHPAVASPGFGMINANQSCLCSVPTEDTTWGQVKALYRGE
jgi:hypothetical protein